MTPIQHIQKGDWTPDGPAHIGRTGPFLGDRWCINRYYNTERPGVRVLVKLSSGFDTEDQARTALAEAKAGSERSDNDLLHASGVFL